jgi:hypothetical protein
MPAAARILRPRPTRVAAAAKADRSGGWPRDVKGKTSDL